MNRGVLLDTHVLVSVTQPKNLLGKVSERLLRPPTRLYYSPISIAEIKLKESIKGKPLMSEGALEDLATRGLKQLALDSQSAKNITRFPTLHRHDPFDRLLLAQAINHSLLFITGDKRLVELGLEFIHDAQT